jgi:predicted transporter
MAELIKKFFEVNDIDVLIVAFIFFASVIGLWIYTCKKWKEEERENDKTR